MSQARLLKIIIQRRDDALAEHRRWQSILDTFEHDPDLARVLHGHAVRTMTGAREKAEANGDLAPEARPTPPAAPPRKKLKPWSRDRKRAAAKAMRARWKDPKMRARLTAAVQKAGRDRIARRRAAER